MTGEGASLAGFAALLADGTRATLCLALLDGRAWTAGELARHAGVAPSTVSAHLNQLVAGGLLAEEKQGRHRYLRLSGDGAAHMIEDMAVYAMPDGPSPARPSMRAVRVSDALRTGRTCYDHLAGRLGIVLVDALAGAGMLTRSEGMALTGDGVGWLRTLGVDVDALRRSRRPLVRACLDWSERRPHLAGSAGASIRARLMERGWVERLGTDRAVRITAAGRQAFRSDFGVPEEAFAVPGDRH